MIAYRDGRPATVTSGGRVLVEFNGDTAEVSEEVGGILKQAGYRVELSAIGNDDEAQRGSYCRDSSAPPSGAEAPHTNKEDDNDADGAAENADTADIGRGRGISARNGKKRN